MDVTTEVTVSVVNILGLTYSGKGVNVTAELESDHVSHKQIFPVWKHQSIVSHTDE